MTQANNGLIWKGYKTMDKNNLPRCDMCSQCQKRKSEKRDGCADYCRVLNRDVSQSAFGRNSPRDCPYRLT